MDLSSYDQYFYQSWHAFYASFGSLRLFSEQIGRVSAEIDYATIQQAARELAEILNDDPRQIEDEIQQFLSSTNDLNVYPDFRDNSQIHQTLMDLQDSAFKDHLLDWAKKNPRQWTRLAAIFQDYLASPPANSLWLRRSTLIVLLSLLDVLFRKLHFAYFYFQGLDRKITKELQEREAQRHANKFYRAGKGWRGRIERFQELSVDISPLQDYLDEFAEIAHRRNLLVHTDGIIDDVYLKHVPPQHRPPEAQKGRMLLVPRSYLQRAFYLVLIIGFWLTHIAWKKWDPNKRVKRLYRSIDQVIYNELRHRNYHLVVEFAHITDFLKFPKKHKRIKYTILINQAIAFRELGETHEVKRLTARLSKMKRDDLLIKIALAILKGDFARARHFLLQAKQKQILHTISPDWPLFAPLTHEPWFQHLFE